MMLHALWCCGVDSTVSNLTWNTAWWHFLLDLDSRELVIALEIRVEATVATTNVGCSALYLGERVCIIRQNSE